MNSNDFERLCNEVAVVIHAAASVRFNEPIQEAMKTNFQGVCNMLHVATKNKNLEVNFWLSNVFLEQACIHLLFSGLCANIVGLLKYDQKQNCDSRRSLSSFRNPARGYWTPSKHDRGGSFCHYVKVSPSFCSASGDCKDARLRFCFCFERLLEGRPNTYTFAKNLAEQLVQSYRRDLPVCIVRPSTSKLFFFLVSFWGTNVRDGFSFSGPERAFSWLGWQLGRSDGNHGIHVPWLSTILASRLKSNETWLYSGGSCGQYCNHCCMVHSYCLQYVREMWNIGRIYMLLQDRT